MVQLIRERRLLQPSQHLRGYSGTIKFCECQQALAFGLRGYVFSLRWMPCIRSQLLRDLKEHGASQQIIATRSQVHVLIHQVTTNDSVWTFFGESRISVDQFDARD